jgi:hypothetical protein
MGNIGLGRHGDARRAEIRPDAALRWRDRSGLSVSLGSAWHNRGDSLRLPYERSDDVAVAIAEGDTFDATPASLSCNAFSTAHSSNGLSDILRPAVSIEPFDETLTRTLASTTRLTGTRILIVRT